MVAQSVAREPLLVSQIRRGMLVCDRYGEEIGTVRRVCLTAGKPESAPPDALRGHLVMAGYIEIGTGLLSGNRYARVEQVRSLHDDVVFLTACKRDLPGS